MATCRHRYLRIEEFNALGVVAFCLICRDTFDQDDYGMEHNYYPFTYTSPDGPDEDIHLLIHRRVIDEDAGPR